MAASGFISSLSFKGSEFSLLTCFVLPSFSVQIFIILDLLPDFTAVGLVWKEIPNDPRVFKCVVGEMMTLPLSELQQYKRCPWCDVQERPTFEWHPLVCFLQPIQDILASSWLHQRAHVDTSFERKDPVERQLFYGHQWRRNFVFVVCVVVMFLSFWCSLY
jgi:hypothetical protein